MAPTSDTGPRTDRGPSSGSGPIVARRARAQRGSVPALRHAWGVKHRVLTVTCALVLLAGACSNDDKDASPTEPGKATAAQVAMVNPLTGTDLPKAPDNPVFVVKVDNTTSSAPQTNVDKADLVIEETVEGGITRLAALFYSELPDQVGHIRSTRATDIGIAEPVAGQIVASGGAGGTLKRIRKAGIALHTQDAGDPGFTRDSGYAPYNVMVDLTKVNADARNVQPKRPYLVWGPSSAKPPAGTAVSKATVRFSRSHATTWAFGGKAWKRTNGTSAREFAAQNLLVLFADEKPAGYLDPAGNPVPETVFEGTGKAIAFIGATKVEGTWSKSGLDSTISLKGADGADLKVPAGPTWIELVNKNDGEVTAL